MDARLDSAFESWGRFSETKYPFLRSARLMTASNASISGASGGLRAKHEPVGRDGAQACAGTNR